MLEKMTAKKRNIQKHTEGLPIALPASPRMASRLAQTLCSAEEQASVCMLAAVHSLQRHQSGSRWETRDQKVIQKSYSTCLGSKWRQTHIIGEEEKDVLDLHGDLILRTGGMIRNRTTATAAKSALAHVPVWSRMGHEPHAVNLTIHSWTLLQIVLAVVSNDERNSLKLEVSAGHRFSDNFKSVVVAGDCLVDTIKDQC